MHGCRGVACMVGGHVWLLGGIIAVEGRWGCGMRGCRVACMVAGGHAWLQGGMHG